jgi:hypothetical protein
MAASPPPASKDKSFIGWCAAAVAITFLLQLWLCRRLIAAYLPTSGDLAVEVASTAIGGPVHAWTWLTQGFHFYYQSYPEWQAAQTDFCRPLANALFWLHYQLFGAAWGSQLIFGYLAHALTVGLTGYIASRVFRLSVWLALIAMIIAALNPGFWTGNDIANSVPYNTQSELLQYPIFQTEIPCALLMMAAFVAFVRGRYLWFCVIATGALLLKETSLTVPVAAIVLVGVWWRANTRQALSHLVYLLLPIMIWYSIRAFVFQYGHSFYVLTSGSEWGWLFKPIRNLLYLPSTLYHGPLGATVNALRTHDWATLALHGFQLLANAIWWLAVLYALYRAWLDAGRQWLTAAAAPWICGLVFVLGNIALVMLLQSPDRRFAYFWFALGPAVVFRAFMDRRHAVPIAAALAATLCVPQLFTMQRSFSASALHNYELIKHSASSLYRTLGTLPEGVTNVYLLDDLVTQAASPDFLARFAGYRGRLVVVNSITPIVGCSGAAPGAQRYRLQRDAAGVTLDYHTPDCFYPWYEPPLQLADSHNQLPRGPWMSYRYPELKGPRVAPPGEEMTDYDIGQHWTLTVTDPACAAAGACVWLGLDPTLQKYYVLTD